MEQLLSDPRFAGVLAGIVSGNSQRTAGPAMDPPGEPPRAEDGETDEGEEESTCDDESEDSKEEERGEVAGPSNAGGQPGGWPQLSAVQLVQANAVRLLAAQGVPIDRAVAAVAACEPGTDPTDLAETAQVWLAQQAEIEQETTSMAAAMEASLQEAEHRKAAEKPLVEQSDEELRQRFEASSLLPKLKNAMGTCPLGKPELRNALLDLLELERKALRWYTCGGTRIYFDRLAEECAEKAAPREVLPGKGNKRKAKSENGQAAEACVEKAASCKVPNGKGNIRKGSPDKRRSTRRKVSNSESATPDCSPPESDSPSPGGSSELVDFLLAAATGLKEGMYQMPERGGQVPTIFAELNEMEEDDDLEITADISCSAVKSDAHCE